MSFGKMTIGKAGTKYGLHRPNAAAKAKPVASIFGDADEEDPGSVDPSKALMSEKHREKMQKRAEKEMAKALAVDASIFDYDGAHDEIVADRERQDKAKASGSAQTKKQVRYVHALLEKTQERKLDDERLFEKRLVRELKEEEKELGGASEKFVTAAYRAQLEANKKWEEDQAKLDKLKAKDDVTDKADLTDFYSNMLRGKNAATGGRAVRGGSPPKDVLAEKAHEREEAARKKKQDEEEADRRIQAAAAAAAAAAHAKEEAKGEVEKHETFMPSMENAQRSAGVNKEDHPADTGGAEEGGDSRDETARESAQQERAAEGADGAKRKYDGWVATAYGACLIVREAAFAGGSSFGLECIQTQTCLHALAPAHLSLDRLSAPRPHARMHTQAMSKKRKLRPKPFKPRRQTPKSSQPGVLASASQCFSHLRRIPLASPTLRSHYR